MKELAELPKRCPVNGTFELTIRCNLHCKMCLFRHADCENATLQQNELTTEQWISLGEQVAKAGTLSLLITGGEPLLRKDFCEIYEGLYQQGFLITLYTNATLVTPEILQLFQKYPPHRIGVTLYGASAAAYEKVCGNGAAFEKAVEGIKLLQTLPSILQFRMAIIKDNYEEVEAIETLVRKEFSSDAIVTQPNILIASVRGACTNVQACRLSPEENIQLLYRRVFSKAKQIMGEYYREDAVKFKRVESEACSVKEHYSLVGCMAGMDQYAITWDGKLQGCQLLDAFQTDAAQEGFLNAWERFPYAVNMPPLNDTCQNCNLIHDCQCCPASRLAETGDLGGLPEYACAQTKILKEREPKDE